MASEAAEAAFPFVPAISPGTIAAMRDAYDAGQLHALRQAQLVLRGEGEAGNAGEMISVNYADEVLEELRDQARSDVQS